MGFLSYQIEMVRLIKVLIHLTNKREPGTERDKGWPCPVVFNIKRQEAQTGLTYPKGEVKRWARAHLTHEH